MLSNVKTTLWLSIIAMIGLVPSLFTSDEINVKKIDIYLFYDKLRYPENIAFDVCEFITVSFFIYLIWRLVPFKQQKRYVFCFFISSVLNIVGYFLFYSQLVSIIQIPILIGLLIYTHYKNGHEERNNIG